MPRLFITEDVQPETISNLVSQHSIDVKDQVIPIHKIILCDNGILFLGSNPDLWEADIKHWIPEQRKQFDEMYTHFKNFTERKNPYAPIPSISLKPVDPKGREVEINADNKAKKSLDFFYSQNDNLILSLVDM